MKQQGSFEEPTIIITIMINYFYRLTKIPSDSDQLKYIMRNLHRYYASHLSLVSVNSVDDLISLCKKLEEARLQNSRFRGTAHGSKCLEQSDLKQQTSEVKLCDSKFSRNSRQFTRGDSNRLVCWNNCKRAIHNYQNCMKPPTDFC